MEKNYFLALPVFIGYTHPCEPSGSHNFMFTPTPADPEFFDPPRFPVYPELRYELERDYLGEWTIRLGDRYQDMLGEDEALYLIARILLTDGTVRLRTVEDHRRYHAAVFGPASILRPWQKLIQAPVLERLYAYVVPNS